MSTDFEPLFARLRGILEKQAARFTIGDPKPGYYGLEAPVGPATIREWGGKVRRPTIPVAWIQSGKAYVSYHLMGVSGNPKRLDECSAELRAHMQGKSCFNFKEIDETLLRELEQLTEDSLNVMKRAGYISAGD